MKSIFNHLYLLFLTIILNNCSDQLPMIVIDNYWEQTRYFVSSYNDVVGKYIASSGLNGTTIELYNDSTFFYNIWCDILTDEDLYVRGNLGKYTIFLDTLFLHVSSYKYHNSLNYDQLQYAKLHYPNDSTFKVTTNKLLFKRIGNDILLVQERSKYFFSDYMLKYQYYEKLNDKSKYGVFFPLKTEQ